MTTDRWHLRAGHPRSAVLLHVPHASRTIPPEVRAGLLLSDDDLEAELDRMTDAGTAELAEAAADAAGLRPWSFVNARSRLVVDPERFPDEREELAAVGMGAVYTRTSLGEPLRPAGAPELVERFFTPYATAVADAVDEVEPAAGRGVVLDVHSYAVTALPYERHQHARRPQVCLGTDAQHTSSALLAAARHAFRDFEVELDQPFRGTYTPLRHHGRDAGVLSLMLEIRRDVPPQSPAVVAALAELVDACE